MLETVEENMWRIAIERRILRIPVTLSDLEGRDLFTVPLLHSLWYEHTP